MLKKILNTALQGFFWILPILLIVLMLGWLFENIATLTHFLFDKFGVDTDKYFLLWMAAGLVVGLLMLWVIGAIANTRIATLLELWVKKVPFYSTLKDMVAIFNASKKGKNKVLVVAVKAFGQPGYNIGLMYSTKQSIIKDHYTVTLSMSPIPNGGFMFEVHQDDILVVEGATFNDNLNYLLSMGTKSLSDILNKAPGDLISFTQWKQQQA